MVYTSQSRQTEYHLGNDAFATHVQINTTVNDNTYDGWGNVTSQTISVKNATGDILSTTTTANTYGNSDYDKRMGRLTQSQVSKTLNNDSNTAITRQSHFSYYSQGESCQIAGSTAGSQIKGLLKITTINGKVTSHCYNGYGQTVSSQISAMLNLGDTQASQLISHQQYSDNGRGLIITR